LRSNKIHNAGALELAKNNTLKTLIINANYIGSDGVNALLNNRNIIDLEIGVQLSDENIMGQKEQSSQSPMQTIQAYCKHDPLVLAVCKKEIFK